MSWNPNCTRPHPFKFLTHKDKDREQKLFRIRLYRNGDVTDQGFDFTLDKREYPHWFAFLDVLTVKTKSERPIERLFSVNSGREIIDFNQLRRKGEYVTVGTEAFRRLPYGNAGTAKPDWEKTTPQKTTHDLTLRGAESLNSKSSLQIYLSKHRRRYRHKDRTREDPLDNKASSSRNLSYTTTRNSLLTPDYLIHRLSLVDLSQSPQESGSSSDNKSKSSRSHSWNSNQVSASNSQQSTAPRPDSVVDGPQNSRKYSNESSQYKLPQNSHRTHERSHLYHLPPKAPERKAPQANGYQRQMSPGTRRKASHYENNNYGNGTNQSQGNNQRHKRFADQHVTRLQKAYSVLSGELDEEYRTFSLNSSMNGSLQAFS